MFQKSDWFFKLKRAPMMILITFTGINYPLSSTVHGAPNVWSYDIAHFQQGQLIYFRIPEISYWQLTGNRGPWSGGVIQVQFISNMFRKKKKKITQWRQPPAQNIPSRFRHAISNFSSHGCIPAFVGFPHQLSPPPPPGFYYSPDASF